LRAHKKEPLVYLSILQGCLVGLSTWVLGKHYSALGMAVGYLIVFAIILPLIIFIWQRCRTRWHNSDESS
ncbi:MAG: hypothetical protein WCQ90_07195, partial [Deltaproteobacteria bacterium]